MPVSRRNSPSKIAASRPFADLIRVVRGEKIVLDEDLSGLYGVETRVLVQAVKRNIARFPMDFMFQLTAAEWIALKSQTVISKPGRGGRRFAPYAFTEQGVAMLSSVLASERGIAVNIQIMRAFVRMRELMAANSDIAARVGRLEQRHDRTASVIEVLVEDIDRLGKKVERLKSPAPLYGKRKIGYIVDDE